MNKFMAASLIFCALAAGGASAASKQYKCGIYELHGKLVNPAPGRYELLANAGSQGQFAVRLLGLPADQKSAYRNVQVQVEALALAPFDSVKLYGSTLGLDKARVIKIAKRDDVLRNPFKFKKAASCR